VSGTERGDPFEPDPNESPFELRAVAGLPFGKDSEEARAVQAAIEEADRERAGRDRA
jgi:hypothetical protein